MPETMTNSKNAIDELVLKLAAEANAKLTGAKIRHYESHFSKSTNSWPPGDYGTVSSGISFDIDEPKFVKQEDYDAWHNFVHIMADEKFAFYGFKFWGANFYHPFVEIERNGSGDTLTPELESKIRQYVDTLQKFAEWYHEILTASAVVTKAAQSYENIASECISGLKAQLDKLTKK